MGKRVEKVMLSFESKDNYINLFDNITDLSQYLSSKKRKEGRDKSSEDSDSSFSGTKSFQEAFDLFRYGDEELYKKFKEQSSKINIDKLLGNAVRKQKYVNRNYGCVPNVPNYLIGNPLNMINAEIGRISHKVINIFLSIGVPWTVDKEDIINTGIIYLSVIDLLEKAGYRCNLYAGVTASSAKHEYMYVRIKTDREPLNLKKLVFPLVHPSMLRRIYFRWAEVNDYDYDITGGYGKNDDEKTILNNMKKIYNEDFILWTYNNIGKNKDHNIKKIEEILEDLKKKGIELNI